MLNLRLIIKRHQIHYFCRKSRSFMRNRYLFLTSLMLIGLPFGKQLSAQATNPTPQSLPYSENFSSYNGSSTTYPAGWQGWIIPGGSTSSYTTGAASADQTVSGGTAASSGNGVYDFLGKIGWLNSGGTANGVATAIVTTGLSNITVNYTMMVIRDPFNGSNNTRINAAGLQYRVGTSGNFTDVQGTSYASSGVNQTSGTTPLNPANYSIVLPPQCDNQAVVQLRWISKDSLGGGSRPSFAVDSVSVSGSVNTGIPVSLSFSSNTGSEAAGSQITITATASSAVTANETVDLNVYGANITSGDYSLSNSTISIANGQTTGSVTLTVTDDALNELPEQLIVGIQNLSSGLSIGTPSTDTLTITDNDQFIDLASLGTPTALETFDQMDTVGTGLGTYPKGVYVYESGSGDSLYDAGNGSSFSGDSYSFGDNGSSERAFGSLTTGSISTIHLGAGLLNNTGSAIDKLVVSYKGEQWRTGGNAGGDSLYFEYSLDAADLNSGTWTAFSPLNFGALVFGGSSASLDGNLPANSLAFLDTITLSTPVLAGDTIWVRWRDQDVTGSDDGLAIDSLLFTPVLTPCPEPTQQVSNPAASNITSNSANLSWTNGNGTGRLVVVRQGQSVADMPMDGNAYNANPNFATVGTELGTGYVVYSGSTGNSVSIANLQPSTTYYVAIFEYDCNPEDYLTTSPALDTIVTPAACQAPSQAAGNITFANITNTSMDVSWTNGNGTNRILIAREGQAVADLPQNGTNYPANAQYGTTGTDLGTGYVVFNGTGNSVTVSNLLPNTTYHYLVVEYDCNPEVYGQASMLSDATTTNMSIDNNNKSQARIYPNPAKVGNIIQIDGIEGAWTLSDISGRTVRQNIQGQLATQGLQAGMYILHHSNGQAVRILLHK